jgi:hypothetical protein
MRCMDPVASQRGCYWLLAAQVQCFLITERLRLREELWDRLSDQEFLVLQQQQLLQQGPAGDAGARAGAPGRAVAPAAAHLQMGDFQRKITAGAMAALVGTADAQDDDGSAGSGGVAWTKLQHLGVAALLDASAEQAAGGRDDDWRCVGGTAALPCCLGAQPR